jgi:GDPmannose 4,6-dehydratase
MCYTYHYLHGIDVLKKALITGITGQDGSYLAELLCGKGYEVHGIIRRASQFNTDRIDHLYGPARRRARGCSCTTATCRTAPCCAGSSRPCSRTRSTTSARSRTCACRSTSRSTRPTSTPWARCACSSACGTTPARSTRTSLLPGRLIGDVRRGPPPQSEATPFYPRSPYAVSKVAAHWYAVNYREAYGLFICNGILFNHESPRRGETFVTRKITRAVGASSWASRTSSTWATSTPGATGALPATSSRRCG